MPCIWATTILRSSKVIPAHTVATLFRQWRLFSSRTPCWFFIIWPCFSFSCPSLWWEHWGVSSALCVQADLPLNVWFAVLQKRTGGLLHRLPVHHRVQHSFCLHWKDSHPGNAWDLPLEEGWHQEIPLVARKGLLKGQHRGFDLGSTGTGPKLPIHRSRSLPQLTGPEWQTVQRHQRLAKTYGCENLSH